MLVISRETDDYIMAYCVFHQDRGRANLRIDKTGEYAGKYKCFSCGKFGDASELGLKISKSGKVSKGRKKAAKDFYSKWVSYQEPTPDLLSWPIWKPLGRNLLMNYGLRWCDKEQCAVYPMVDSDNKIIGLQRRFQNDRKICIKYSRLGVFVPQTIQNKPVYVCEGYSDTVWTASLGLFAIGRPNADCIDETVDWLLKHTNNEVVIMSDVNSVGVMGSARIFHELSNKNRDSIITLSLTKDVRQDIITYGHDYMRDYLKELV